MPGAYISLRRLLIVVLKLISGFEAFMRCLVLMVIRKKRLASSTCGGCLGRHRGARGGVRR